MRFGERVRQLRNGKGYDLRTLAGKVGVHFTYLSKVENERLDFGDYPSDQLIGKWAVALEADADELMLLAKKVPEKIRRRILERPNVFRKLADLDDAGLDRVLGYLDRSERKKTTR